MAQDRAPEGVGSGALLGNYVNIVAIPGQGPDLSSWAQLRWLWQNTSLPALRKCHKIRYGSSIRGLVAPDGTAWLEGFCRCHSVWACPICAPGIRRGLALDLQGGLVRHLVNGGGLLLAVLTTSHDAGDRLGATFSAVADGFRSVIWSRALKEFRRDNPFEFTRSAEVTYGRNGFNPHLNLLVVTERPSSRDEVVAIRDQIFPLWARSLTRAGYREPHPKYGIEVKRCDAKMADYVVKVDKIANEMTAMGTKTRKRNEHTTEQMFSVLRRAVAGDPVAAVVWAEYEMATKGRRCLTYSRGFRSLVGLGGELSEAEALERAQGRGVVVGEVTGYLADMVARHPRGIEVVLEAIGSSTGQGWDSALSALRGSLPWSVRADLDRMHYGLELGKEPDEVVRIVVQQADGYQPSLGDMAEVGF